MVLMRIFPQSHFSVWKNSFKSKKDLENLLPKFLKSFSLSFLSILS
ncbi:hypothetical protein HMPREF1127_0748 [Fusobacterium necrophorum subsp. funduliforme Fnf 1007]|uniref:Uncharacterized protein n=1 Tax=Fusobacterium necrophorum subsp. funduliforme Fnf 1007 TaxID=1161424 RepID=A0AAN3VW80_9FUSO|nr:hypothetical protein HMPREF1127_0748 [Fusobacterium necrophorum subsp. funduliforme Fnf 1007]